jgi:hypothetical protein
MAIYTPDRYPLHDTGDVNSANLPTAYSLQGFPSLSVADPRATNALLQANGGWTQYNDFTLVRAIDTHNSSTAYRLSLNLGYATGAGLESLSPTTNPVYVFRGNVIRFRESFLMDQGLDPITFTASMRTWIYCGADGTVRVDVVALATGATPAVGEFTVIGVDTDATDITAIVTTSSPAFELHFTGPNYIIDTNFAVLGDSSFVGNVDVTGVVTLGAGGLDMNGSSISNADNIGCETLVANTSVDTATLDTTGLATLNQLAVTTTSAFTGIINPLAGINLAGQTISGTASSVVDVERVLVDKLEMTDMTSSFSNTGGHGRWNTTALMFAQSAVIAKTNAVEIPQRGFDLVFSTVNAIDDTTATVTRNIQAAEPVWIEVYFRWEISVAATNMNFRVQVTGPAGSADLGLTTFRATVQNVGYPFACVLRWTPTDNFALPGTQSYAFLVRLGTGAGTLTCANIMVKIASALEV